MVLLVLLPLVREQFDGFVAEMVEPPGDVGAVLHLLDEEGLFHAGLVARLDAADHGSSFVSPVVVPFLVVLLSAFVSECLTDIIFAFFHAFILIVSLVFIVGLLFIILLRERAEFQMSANEFGRRIVREHFMEMILATDE